MPAAQPLKTRSSTSNIMLLLAGQLILDKSEMQQQADNPIPARLVATVAIAENQLAASERDLKSKPDFTSLKGETSFIISKIDAENPTPATKTLARECQGRLDSLKPQQTALNESYIKLETDLKSLEEKCWDIFIAVYTRVQKARNPDDELSSSVNFNELQKVPLLLQRFKTQLSATMHITAELEDKFNSVKATVTTLLSGIQQAAGTAPHKTAESRRLRE